MSVQKEERLALGKSAALLVLLQHTAAEEQVKQQLDEQHCRYTVGKVGSMDMNKVIAAIETSAKANAIINPDSYREIHALYHTILEAVQGVGRGSLQFGEILRTVGLTFSVVRGKMKIPEHEDEWISVCIYGTIGAPKKGFEHEVLGLGFNHI